MEATDAAEATTRSQSSRKTSSYFVRNGGSRITSEETTKGIVHRPVREMSIQTEQAPSPEKEVLLVAVANFIGESSQRPTKRYKKPSVFLQFLRTCSSENVFA